MRYSKLIVATGMRPRYLPGQSSGITVYNSSDVERLQELVSGKRVTVVGGSYLGVETAANLVMLKKKNKLESMTLVIGEDHPLSTSYGEMIGKASLLNIMYLKGRCQVAIHCRRQTFLKPDTGYLIGR